MLVGSRMTRRDMVARATLLAALFGLFATFAHAACPDQAQVEAAFQTGGVPFHQLLAGDVIEFATFEEAPYAEYNAATQTWSGFVIDLIRAVAAEGGFDITITRLPFPDGSPGNTISEMLVRETLRHDILGPFFVDNSARRAMGVSFTHHFIDTSAYVIVHTPTNNQPNWWRQGHRLFDPFTRGVWGLIIGATVFLGVVHYVVSGAFYAAVMRFHAGRRPGTPRGKTTPCVEENGNGIVKAHDDDATAEGEGDGTRGGVGLAKALTAGLTDSTYWAASSAVAGGDMREVARNPLTKMMVTVWGFMTVIIVASYTANLTSFLVVQATQGSINGINDLIVQGTPTCVFHTESLATQLPQKFPQLRVREVQWQSEGFQPYIDSGQCGAGVQGWGMAESWLGHGAGCNFTMVGAPVTKTGGGFAYSSVNCGPLFGVILDAIFTRLEERGEIDALWKRWKLDQCPHSPPTVSSSATTLNVRELGFLFVLLLISSAFAICVHGVMVALGRWDYVPED
ncbi:unnamed protein product [Pedinophyceae sp. YPF-701]|nr:unnamed protein product [Pedinophyceae sp. YPF-701]